MTGARLDGAIVAFDGFNKIRVIHSERSREISDCRTEEYFAFIVHQPRIGCRCFTKLENASSFAASQLAWSKISTAPVTFVRSRQFIGDRDVAAPLVDKAVAVTIDQNSFVDEGIESRIRPEAVVDERFA